MQYIKVKYHLNLLPNSYIPTVIDINIEYRFIIPIEIYIHQTPKMYIYISVWNVR